ncbi:MAG: bifunctional hydroxymethylpyrimidine kinase/phosphomethylpyrimidine kinase [Nitrospirae bacterium]|nr:MAG: bifunctional hydroxymethylpyrimidine kinase/phosphomethylpyrimidine kinase [Nitrospirota bacterium]
MKKALTIAGFDPTGGAGLQADLKVFHRFGVYGLSAVAALTAQNTLKVASTLGIDAGLLEDQLKTLINDIRPDALKTGMLFSRDAVAVVAKEVRGFELQNLVVDPVTVSSTGKSLVEDGTLDMLKTFLFPVARVITPNIYEASLLSGVSICDEYSMELAAKELKKTGVEVVIITGGHFDDLKATKKSAGRTMELLYDGGSFHRIRGVKVPGEYHGTGCAFSAAITACLAKGMSVYEAAKKARRFMEGAVKSAVDFGKGMKLLKL